jgi:hypothetical protein
MTELIHVRSNGVGRFELSLIAFYPDGKASPLSIPAVEHVGSLPALATQTSTHENAAEWIATKPGSVGLVLIVGPGASALLGAVAQQAGARVIDVGSSCSHELRTSTVGKAEFSVVTKLIGLAQRSTTQVQLLLDNLDMLFGSQYRLDPLRLLKLVASKRYVVAVWPGALSEGRLTYGLRGTPGFRCHPIDGFAVRETT